MQMLAVLPFLFGTCIEFFGMPWAVRYLMDPAWLLLVALLLLGKRLGKGNAVPVQIWIILFLIYTVLVYLVQYQSILYYLWGFRNVFRFYAAFLGFAAFMRPEDAEDNLKLFDKLFWLNAVISLVQFFVLDLKGDYLGGLFGAQKGGNGYTNIFLLIIVSKALVFYLDKRVSLGYCAAQCTAALLVAVMAELKFFFVEFVLVIIMASVFTDFSWRKAGIIIGGLIATEACAVLLTKLFPEFYGWFSIQWFLEKAQAASGYTMTGDLNRLNAIPRINELWLHSFGERLFGLGLGNCENSTFSFLNTPFHKANEGMHYSWMAHATMYLECGWVGLLFYFGFFVLVFLNVWKIEHYAEGTAKSYCRICRIMAILCMIISVYNSSMRAEPAYMVYFVLAIPFAVTRTTMKRKLTFKM